MTPTDILFLKCLLYPPRNQQLNIPSHVLLEKMIFLFQVLLVSPKTPFKQGQVSGKCGSLYSVRHFCFKRKEVSQKKNCFRKASSQFLSGFIDDVSSPGHEMIPPFALPETSIEFTPQKRRLEDNPFLLELHVFTCLVLGHVFLGSCH